jgi:hypothetical protein
MWLSKTLDVLGALIYISLLLFGFWAGFRKSLRITFYLFVITLINAIVYRIFKHFLLKEYLILIELSVLVITSVVTFFVFKPLAEKIYELVGDIEPKIVDRMVGLLQFLINGILIIGYLIIFSGFIPQLYYILDSSSLLRVFENILKLAIGIKIF